MSLTLLIIIQTITYSPFHVETVSLMHILLYDLCQATEEHKVMPIGMIRNLHTISQGISLLCCCKRHLSHSLIRIIIMHIRFLSNMTNQHYLIHSFFF